MLARFAQNGKKEEESFWHFTFIGRPSRGGRPLALFPLSRALELLLLLYCRSWRRRFKGVQRVLFYYCLRVVRSSSFLRTGFHRLIDGPRWWLLRAICFKSSLKFCLLLLAAAISTLAFVRSLTRWPCTKTCAHFPVSRLLLLHTFQSSKRSRIEDLHFPLWNTG